MQDHFNSIGTGDDGPKTSQLLTKAELAPLLKVTTRTLDDWMARGLIPYLKIGRTVRFRLADVEEYLRQNFLVARRSFRQPELSVAQGGMQ